MINTSSKQIGDHQYEVMVLADADDVDIALDKAARQFIGQYMGSDMGLNIPPEVDTTILFDKMAGRPETQEYMKNAVAEYVVPFAVDQLNINMIASPSYENLPAPEKGQPYTFSMKIFEAPEFDLDSYEEARMAVHGPEPITNEAVDNQMSYLLRAYCDATGEANVALNDAWVSKAFSGQPGMQGVTTVAALRKALRADAEHYVQEMFYKNMNFELMSAWGIRLKGEPSRDMVNAYAQDMISGEIMELAQQGNTLEQALEMRNMTEDQYFQEMQARAMVLLKGALAMDAIYRHEKMKLTAEDFVTAAESMEPNKDPQLTIEQMREQGRGFLLDQTARRTKASKWALEHTNVNQIQRGYRRSNAVAGRR